MSQNISGLLVFISLTSHVCLLLYSLHRQNLTYSFGENQAQLRLFFFPWAERGEIELT